MPLLEIKPTKKVTALCTLEESTALQVDQYAAFAKASADEVVNKALEYAFGKDSEFQKFRGTLQKPPAALRVKKSVSASTGARRGPRPAPATAN